MYPKLDSSILTPTWAYGAFLELKLLNQLV